MSYLTRPGGWLPSTLGGRGANARVSLGTRPQLAMLVAIFTRTQAAHAACWPGWAPRRHVTRERVAIYARQYVPAAVAIASDFWRVAAIGAVAATLGEAELAVFNASYRVLWLALMFCGALAGALGILLARALGAGQPQRARFTTRCGVALSGARCERSGVGARRTAALGFRRSI